MLHSYTSASFILIPQFFIIAPAPLLGPATATPTWNKHCISLKAANFLAVLAEPLLDITAATMGSPYTLMSRVITDRTRSEWSLGNLIIASRVSGLYSRTRISSMTPATEISKESYIGHAYRAINSLLVDYTIRGREETSTLSFSGGRGRFLTCSSVSTVTKSHLDLCLTIYIGYRSMPLVVVWLRFNNTCLMIRLQHLL